MEARRQCAEEDISKKRDTGGVYMDYQDYVKMGLEGEGKLKLILCGSVEEEKGEKNRSGICSFRHGREGACKTETSGVIGEKS